MEGVRFELTDPFGSSVFKTGAINRTLPTFHIEAHSPPRSMISRRESNPESMLLYGAPNRIRTDSYDTPFERAAFTNLAIGALLGVRSRIRTDGFRVLQTLALGLSATLTLFGVPRGIRTPTSSFGDCRAAVKH